MTDDLADDVWATVRGRQAELAILRRTAEGANPVLAELAREVLTGRHGMRELARSSAYAEEMYQRMRPLFDRWQAMSDAERHEAAANADRYNQELLALFETRFTTRAQTPARPPHAAVADDEDFSERSYLRRP